MNAMNEKIRKAPKDKDLAEVFYFLRVSVLIVPLLCLLGFYVGYTQDGLSGAVLGILLAVAGGLLLSFAIMYLLDAVGGASGILFGRKRAVWTTREQVQGLLSQARFNKDNQEFTVALEYINQVLGRDPHYPDALLLKAQILWQGFEDADSARLFLEKIISMTESGSTIHTQASSLYSELPVMGNSPVKDGSLQGIHIGLVKHRPPMTSRLSHIFFEDLKEKIEETPISRWTIGITIVFAFLLLLLAAVMNLQFDKLENTGMQTLHAIQQVHDEVAANAGSIQQTETVLKKIVSQTTTLNDDL
jgi:Na+-transporting methylmalonyl-CoA/oxaloacetate decarboxylase gamma subunit